MRQAIANIQNDGTDLTVTYTLPDGTKAGFTFVGAPFKGKTRTVIDAALMWEINKFSKEQGWA
jgi:hypothetical protein